MKLVKRCMAVVLSLCIMVGVFGVVPVRAERNVVRAVSIGLPTAHNVTYVSGVASHDFGSIPTNHSEQPVFLRVTNNSGININVPSIRAYNDQNRESRNTVDFHLMPHEGASLAPGASAYFAIRPEIGRAGLRSAYIFISVPGGDWRYTGLHVQYTGVAPPPTQPPTPPTRNVTVSSEVNIGGTTWAHRGYHGSHQLEPGESITIPQPSRPGTGYTFVHWVVTGIGTTPTTHTTPDVQITMPSSVRNITVVARWNPPPVAAQQLTISNYPALGFAVSGESIPIGQTVSGLRNPGDDVQLNAGNRIGWTFSGWELTTPLAHPLNSANTSFPMPSHPVNITARWVQNGAEPRSITVRQFGPDGPILINNETRLEGSTVFINAGTREGYTFTGWTSVPATAIPQTAIASFTMPTTPITVTGNWTANRHNVSITHLNIPHSLWPSNATVVGGGVNRAAGSNITVNAGDAPTGFVFGGWNIPSTHITDNGNPGQFVMPNHNVVAQAIWIQEGVATREVRIFADEAATAFVPQIHPVGSPVPLHAGTRDGYAFAGWQVRPTSQAVDFALASSNSTTFIMPAGTQPILVEATWTQLPAGQYTVTMINNPFWANATTVNPSINRQSITPSSARNAPGVVAGTPIELNPGYRSGYSFTGWESVPHVAIGADNSFNMPSFSVIITANWTPNDVQMRQITIENKIGNINGNLITDTALIDRQTTSGLRFAQGHAHVTVDAGTIRGFYFDRWVVTPTQSPPLFALATNSVQTFVMPSADITLTAIWNPVPIGTQSVSINNLPHIALQESAIAQGTLPAPHTHQIGSRVHVYSAARTGYTFTGWTITPAFVTLLNPTLSAPAGTVHVTSFDMPDSPVTVTANWVRNNLPQLGTPVVNISGATISWPLVPNATEYRIYVGGLEVASVTSTTLNFNLNSLTPQLGVGTHLVQVRAIGNNTTHIDSNLSIARSFVNTPPVTPDSIRPTGLSIVNSILRWNPVMDAARYYIYVNGSRRATIQSTPTSTFNPANPSFDLSTINNPSLTTGGAGYEIQVRAVVGTVTSNLSDVRRFYAATPPLGTPRNIRIVGNPTLMWDFDANPNLVGFRIYVNGQAGPMVGPEVRSFPIANLNLTAGTYLIGVRAIGNGSGNTDSYISTFVQYVSSTLPALDTPINLNITSHTLTWNAVPNAVGYRIYVNGQPSTAGIIGGLSFNLTSLNLGTGTHLIQVRAIGNNTTHTDSAISAFVTYVLGNPSNSPAATPAPRVNTAQYVVTFNPGQGSFPSGEDGLRMGPSGFVINSFTNTPTRPGYTFGGWQVGSTPVSLPLTVNGDMTLNAIWNRIATPSPTPAPAGTRPNPQTGAFGWLNIVGVVVLTGVAVVVVKKMGKKNDNPK